MADKLKMTLVRKQVLKWIEQKKITTAHEASVYLAIAREIAAHGECHLNNQQLRKRAGVSKRQVIPIVQRLKDQGFLTVIQQDPYKRQIKLPFFEVQQDESKAQGLPIQ